VFARHSSYHPGALDEQKAAYSKLRGAAGDAQEGSVRAGIARQQLGESSTSTESSPDTLNASFDQLQVPHLALTGHCVGSGRAHTSFRRWTKRSSRTLTLWALRPAANSVLTIPWHALCHWVYTTMTTTGFR
jgi:hypothetical protein